MTPSLPFAGSKLREIKALFWRWRGLDPNPSQSRLAGHWGERASERARASHPPAYRGVSSPLKRLFKNAPAHFHKPSRPPSLSTGPPLFPRRLPRDLIRPMLDKHHAFEEDRNENIFYIAAVQNKDIKQTNEAVSSAFHTSCPCGTPPVGIFYSFCCIQHS